MNKIRQGPVQPLYIEDWTPYYGMDDLDVWGMPETWGVENYGVVAGQPVMEAAWAPSRKSKIHYYDRVDRFRMTLFHLLGLNGRVRWEVVLAIHKAGWDKRPEKVCERVSLP